MNGYLLPGDANWTEDKAFIADLSGLNAGITRYVLRDLDVDAGRAEPISPEDERAFGQRLIELGQRVQRRAERRKSHTNGLVIEGEAAQLRAPEPGRKEGHDP